MAAMRMRFFKTDCIAGENSMTGARATPLKGVQIVESLLYSWFSPITSIFLPEIVLSVATFARLF